MRSAANHNLTPSRPSQDGARPPRYGAAWRLSPPDRVPPAPDRALIKSGWLHPRSSAPALSQECPSLLLGDPKRELRGSLYSPE